MYQMLSGHYVRCFDAYAVAWLKQLDYVCQEAQKMRWDERDKRWIQEWVYFFPILDLIKHWMMSFSSYRVDGDCVLALLEQIPQRLPDPNALIRASSYSPSTFSLGGQKYKLSGGIRELMKERKAYCRRIETARKATIKKCVMTLIQNLEGLCMDVHTDVYLGALACLSFTRDIETWLCCGEQPWAYWWDFREKQQWGCLCSERDMRADFYFIIQFFLEQLDLVPEVMGWEPLPATWKNFQQQMLESAATGSDWPPELLAFIRSR
jgi:hypothetical protein